MAPDLSFNHANRNITTSTLFEINTAGELIMTDRSSGNLAERNIAHSVLMTLFDQARRRGGSRPAIGLDFSIEELGTNASLDNRLFKITIKPAFVGLTLEILRDRYYIDQSKIKDLATAD